MKQQIIDKIVATELAEEVKQEIISNLVERFLIEPVKAEIKLGDSKIGGYPHLPKDFEYPQEVNFYYEFIAQIKVADLTDCTIPDFPNEGMIYFFIDDDFNVGNVNAKVFVLKLNIDELEIKRPPQNKKSRCEVSLDKTEKTEMKLEIKKGYTMEQHLLDDIINRNTAIDSSSLEELFTRDQVWGFTTTWGGGEAEWSAYLAKRRFPGLYWHTQDYQIKNLRKENLDIKQWVNGKVDEAIVKQKEILNKYEKTLHIYPYWERELIDLEFTKQHLDAFIDNLDYHKTACKNWQMLLSLSSYQSAQICFGDGKMEFFIDADDLKNGNFDNVYCHIYN